MLLEIRKLSVDFETKAERVTAVREASLSLAPGEAVGLVGESGSGTTTLGLAITRLLAHPPAVIRAGEVQFQGQDLLRLTTSQLCRIRGGQIAYIFQEPSTSLNPVLTVGRQLMEMLQLHTALRGAAARQRAMDLLAHVGIPAPAERLGSFPHELSGGMKQRVMIAMAIASTPKLLVADEPTTALDVTLERQIVVLLKRLQRELALSLLVISHNIHLLKQLSDRLVVMWQGTLVEEGPTAQVIAHPRHAYTQRLLAAQPTVSYLKG